jgi:hypothetical protein
VLLHAHGRDASTASTRRFKAKDGAYIREHFFGQYPELRELVAHMSDDEIWQPAPRRPRLRASSTPPIAAAVGAPAASRP